MTASTHRSSGIDAEIFSSALIEWKALLGPQHIQLDKETLNRYARTLIPQFKRAIAVVRPRVTSEVIEVVRIANKHRVPLYPISRGKNWGHGSACPVGDGQVILDLQRMDRILEVNEELAYAVIEPGVTQGQLYQYLRDRNIPLCIDPTGAGPDVSLLGNTLERGFGITPYGDHFAQICGMQIVLGDGELLDTGYTHYENAKAARVFPRGIGPWLDGLFTQSNFGVVTQAGLWLMPTPQHHELCLFNTNRDECLGELIGVIRQLLLSGSIRGSISLMNRNRILTLIRRYPWQEMNGQTPMSDDVAEQLASAKKIGLWNGIVGLYGSRREVRTARSVLRRALRGVTDRIRFVSEAKLRWMERMPPMIGRILGMDLRELASAIRPTLYFLTGTPSRMNLNVPHWRTRIAQPEQPNEEMVYEGGLIWFACAVPITDQCVNEFRQIASAVLNRYRFDSCFTFIAVNARAFAVPIPILYDPGCQEDRERAAKCYDDLLAECGSRGYYPYRAGIQSMDRITDETDVYWRVVRRIKNALDPNAIVSPGRYSLRSSS